jgi:hypothetical protein
MMNDYKGNLELRMKNLELDSSASLGMTVRNNEYLTWPSLAGEQGISNDEVILWPHRGQGGPYRGLADKKVRQRDKNT